MNIKSIVTTAGMTVLLCTPGLSNATAAPPGFDSCVKAFVASLGTKIGVAPRLRDASYLDSSPGLSQPTQIVMTAKDPRDNRVLWQATCYVDSRGKVEDLRDGASRDW